MLALSALDRRTRRTKANLEEGLLQLMETESINSITVRELTEKVDINRSTFYLHYTDIYDMIDQMEQELIDGFYDELDRNREERTTEEDVYHFMEKAVAKLLENRRRILILCGENGDHTFINKLAEVTYRQAHLWFQRILGENADRRHVELAISFFCSGCVALLDKWLRDSSTMNPKVVIDIMFQLVQTGSSGFLKDKPRI